MLQLRSAVAQISEKTGIPPEDLFQYSARELVLLAGQHIAVRQKMLIERRSDAAILVSKDRKHYYYGPDATKVIGPVMQRATDFQEFKGTVGSSGPKVSGRVKIIITQEDLAMMEVGDVMVSIATNYDLVPGMGKAAAIITDEGGILSHAAVVSRELGIPCLIATKNATQILSNGDLVEVDTENGLVRILDERVEK